jgi:hypothetical protein
MPELKEVAQKSDQEIKSTQTEVVAATPRQKESAVITDVRETTPRVPHEVKTWMQKIEDDPAAMKTVQDDSGTTVLTTPVSQNPKVTLPVTRDKFVAGFKKTVGEAGRWLSVFLLRLIKKKKGNVKFNLE